MGKDRRLEHGGLKKLCCIPAASWHPRGIRASPSERERERARAPVKTCTFRMRSAYAQSGTDKTRKEQSCTGGAGRRD